MLWCAWKKNRDYTDDRMTQILASGYWITQIFASRGMIGLVTHDLVGINTYSNLGCQWFSVSRTELILKKNIEL